MVRVLALSVALFACNGCGNGNPVTPDAPDVPGDVLPDQDNASCGDELRFTGEYIDWDSHLGFCGIFEATFEARGEGQMDSTEPNGRFDMCVDSTPEQVILDITLSPDPSNCTSPASTYPLAGIAVASKAVRLAGGPIWSGRNFTTDRQASLGVTLDPAKGHVVVHVEGEARQVALTATHGPAQAINGADWAAGDTGTDVFFPNVDVGTTMLSVTGGAIGTGAVPVEANKVTSVTVIAN